MGYKKFALAYSGGLDTSVIIPWLKEHYEGCEIVAVAVDVGLADELDGLEAKALKTGASKFYLIDIKQTLVKDYIFPVVKAGAKYENKYLLGTSIARPAIAKELARIAVLEKVDAIVHGCTGKGNDQVRFETGIRAFLPDIPIIAPWRVWEIKGRSEEIDYAEAHNIPLKISRETNYSKDKNLWHLSHEGLELEDPANAPKYAGNMELTVTPEEAPDEGVLIEVGFENGEPVSLNGKEMEPVALVFALNELGGKHGVGILDMVENRLVGMKSRGIYETPGGTILFHAHEKLEQICLDKNTQHFKQRMALEYADLIYNGLWFSPLREAMDAFVNETQKTVSGNVKMKLYKGNIIDCGMTSPYSLYDADVATFDEDTVYDQNDSQGFVNLYSLPTKIQARLNEKLNK